MATWIDASTGVREEAGFVPTKDGGLFVYHHVPPGPARQAVVMCPPTHAEFLSNHRREVDFARHLAARGHAVARFHPMGTGNSEGAPGELSFANLVRDGLRATESILEASGAERAAFVGTRLGSLVAAAIATRHPGAPLVAWAPTTARRYLREALRAQRMSSIAAQTDAQDASDAAPTGTHDVLGYHIPNEWPAEFHMDLAEHLGCDPRPVLLVQLSPKPDPQPAQQKLQKVLKERGFEVSSLHSPMGDSWWLHFEGHRAVSEPIGLGLDWLDGAAGGSA